MIQTIENIIPESHQDFLLSKVTDLSFDWHFMPDVTYVEEGEGHNTPGFAHVLVNGQKRSGQEDMFMAPLNEYLYRTNQKLGALHRMRLGCLLANCDLEHNNKHIDFNFEHKVGLYYLNNSDGDTLVWDDDIVTKVSPKKGRFFVFDGKFPHASSCPKEHTTRIVLTYNFTTR